MKPHSLLFALYLYLILTNRIPLTRKTTHTTKPYTNQKGNTMPKVTQEYIFNKKKKIIDAAYELCLEKTVSTVTMQDIINRTGLSQGGIYRFYKDIDEIFGDMLADMRKRVTIKLELESILAKADTLSPGKVVDLIFDMLADNMEAELMGVQKIDLEMSVLAMNAPERVDKILSGAKGVGNKEYLMHRTSEYFGQKMEAGTFTPRIEPMEILAYISSAYTGIQTACIVQHCYNKVPVGEMFQPRRRFRVLATTVKYLMGIDE